MITQIKRRWITEHLRDTFRVRVSWLVIITVLFTPTSPIHRRHITHTVAQRVIFQDPSRTILGTTSASRRRLTQRFAPHAVIKQMCSRTPLPIHRIWLAGMQKAAQPAAIPLRNCILTRQHTAIRQHSTGRHARVAVQNQRELRIRSASITAQHSTGKHAELAATPQEHLHTPTIHTVYARCAVTEERQKRQKSLICRQTILSSFVSSRKKSFGRA